MNKLRNNPLIELLRTAALWGMGFIAVISVLTVWVQFCWNHFVPEVYGPFLTIGGAFGLVGLFAVLVIGLAVVLRDVGGK